MRRFTYVSHLVCNAGVASFKGIDWIACLKQLATDPMAAITAPKFYTQHVGEISADNLGWVWQSNVFGHFILVSSSSVFFITLTNCDFVSSANWSHYYTKRLPPPRKSSGAHP